MTDITPAVSENITLIKSYRNGRLRIDNDDITSPVIICPDGWRLWPTTAPFENLETSLYPLLGSIELLLFGTGVRMQPVPERLLAELSRHVPAIEAMASAAACRTFNIAAIEGRVVAAAIIPETQPEDQARRQGMENEA